jgi:hypothetical protein
MDGIGYPDMGESIRKGITHNPFRLILPCRDNHSRRTKRPMFWLKQIEYEDLLEGDASLVCEECGEDVLIAVLDVFAGMSVSLKSAPLKDMKRRYILEHGDGQAARELAQLLDVPESFVERVQCEEKKN